VIEQLKRHQKKGFSQLTIVGQMESDQRFFVNIDKNKENRRKIL